MSGWRTGMSAPANFLRIALALCQADVQTIAQRGSRRTELPASGAFGTGQALPPAREQEKPAGAGFGKSDFQTGKEAIHGSQVIRIGGRRTSPHRLCFKRSVRSAEDGA